MVDWLLKGEPRKVQIEAIRRSYYGWKKWEKNPDFFAQDPNRMVLSSNGPARGWGHFLRMRMGKTPVFLNEYELFQRDHGFKWAIVFTPNKYKLDWVLEAERFGISKQAFAFDSRTREAAQRWVNRNPQGGLIAVNYEALGYEDTLTFLESICGPKTIIGADESINIKGFDSKPTKAAIKLSKLCGAARDLSGKPITQGPHDLWAQLRFIGEIDGFVYHAFRNTFCKMGGFQGKKIMGSKNETRLQEILDACSWAPVRNHWMITPGADYAEKQIELSGEQARLYNQMQRDFIVSLEDGTIVKADQIITKLLKLQQISSGFLIDENHKVHDIVSMSLNPKAIAVHNMIENEIEGKVVIFAHFTRSIAILTEMLKKFNPAVIRGQMSILDTVAEKVRFNTDPNCRVIIGQSQAIKYGHTLMGSPDDPAYTEIFYENDYSLDTRSQCEERTQGEGQQYPIAIIDLIATNNDRAPIRALQRKEDVAAFILRYPRASGILPPPPTAPLF